MEFIDAELVVFTALLLLAAGFDLREQRIPNWLTGTVLMAGALFSAADGLEGWVAAGAGIAIGFAVFLPFYLKSAMGAGDVKLMAATGAFTGFNAGWAVGLTLVTGGLLGIAYLAGARLMGAGFGGMVGERRFPYALAIAIGSTGAMIGFGAG